MHGDKQGDYDVMSQSDAIKPLRLVLGSVGDSDDDGDDGDNDNDEVNDSVGRERGSSGYEANNGAAVTAAGLATGANAVAADDVIVLDDDDTTNTAADLTGTEKTAAAAAAAAVAVEVATAGPVNGGSVNAVDNGPSMVMYEGEYYHTMQHNFH